MVLNTLIQFPIFAPPNPPHNHRLSTEIRFSRWNNANAEKFIRRERTQKEIEDELRFLKRFNSAHKITTIYNPAPPTPVTGNPAADIYKSTGTPSSPSRRSIPGKASKYSKPPRNASDSHPAFRPIVKPRPIPTEAEKPEPEVKVTEKGVVYELPDAPFVYQYSYTETPKIKPVKLREPAIAPFGPSTMPRPWTGRKPLPPSKKKLQFDSFQLPPPHKKGVKPVQAPGPFLPGSGPKYVQSREEILGEPLTKEEIEELVRSCIKSKRQLNMGRDGLTHNMLDNIHSHWKRRRVCKIRCKGVCTVDLDNVKQQLEEKTGGKIIYSKGGVMYLFRGRNYNYRTRPCFPIMLWKPVTPVYPRLIKRVPEGLTLEEATEMREKGRKLTPICKLAKNGVYYNLVKDVQEAFEACELVRIDCQGVNASDYRKIGAKLQDLVPCVLISFEQEHILMWRGRDWKSSLPGLCDDLKYTENFAANRVRLSVCQSESTPKSCVPNSSVGDAKLNNLNTSDSPLDREYTGSEGVDHLSEVGDENLLSEGIASDTVSDITDFSKNENEVSYVESTTHGMEALTEKISSKMILDGSLLDHNNEEVATIVESEVMSRSSDNSENLSEPLSLVPLTCDKQSHLSGNASNFSEPVNLSSTSTKVLQLWRQAVESGNAIVLEDSNLDADIVYERAIACAQSAPPQPVFRHGTKKKAVQKSEEATKDSEVKEIANIPNKRGHGTKSFKRLTDLNEDNLNVFPQGSLRVDELAKLLA